MDAENRIDSELIEAAIDASYAAGRVIMDRFGKTLQVKEKKDAGLVTDADVLAEQKAIEILKKSRPDFGILAEESGVQKSKNHQARWIIDPLDGTTNYIHGFPMFCVSIGAEIGGKMGLGVVYHPVLDHIFIAVRGKGATMNGDQIKVSKTSTLEDSLLTTGFNSEKNQVLEEELESFSRVASKVRGIRRPGSAALDLAYTACGVFDGFWERKLSPWDVAAGFLLVQEAGGKVTGFDGKPFHVESDQIVATNGALHSLLLKSIQE